MHSFIQVSELLGDILTYFIRSFNSEGKLNGIETLFLNI